MKTVVKTEEFPARGSRGFDRKVTTYSDLTQETVESQVKVEFGVRTSMSFDNPDTEDMISTTYSKNQEIAEAYLKQSLAEGKNSILIKQVTVVNYTTTETVIA